MFQRATERKIRWSGAAWLVMSASLLVGAVGCSSGGSGSTGSQLGATTSTSTPTGEDIGDADGTQVVAQSDGQVEVWERPDEDAPSQMLSAATEPSRTLTFLVMETRGDGWLQVELPTPPPGGRGWVQQDDVTLSRHGYRIEIGRREHTLTMFAGGVAAMTEPVAIGPDAPPAGTATFIKELIIPPEGTPYGGQVYGLAGWTSNEQQFGAGAGVVGIHAAAPTALGTDTLTGAIGADAGVLARLVDDIGLPLGTPVIIRD